MASNALTRPTQGNAQVISIQDANHLDGATFDIADRLEELEIFCRDLAEYYPHVRDLKAIERHVMAARAALEKAKSPARVLWNLSTEAAAAEGRSNG